MNDHSSNDPIEQVLSQLDRPVTPAPDFARTLRARLIDESSRGRPDTGEQTDMQKTPTMPVVIPARPRMIGEHRRTPRWMTGLEIAAVVLLLFGTFAALSGGSSMRDRFAGLFTNQQDSGSEPLGAASMLGGDAGRTGQQPGPAPEYEFVNSWTIPVEGVDKAGFAPVGLGETVYRVISLVPASDLNGSGRTMIQAVDITSGAIRWQQELNVWGSPAVTEDLVFVNVLPDAETANAEPARLVALDTSDGEQVWSVDIGSADNWNSNVSPIVDGENVYTALANGTVVAVEGRSGRVLWTSTDAAPGEQKQQPSVVGAGQLASGAGTIYVVNTSNEVVALDQSTGKERWTIDVAARYQVQPQLTSLLVVKNIVVLQVGGTNVSAEVKTPNAAANAYVAVEGSTGNDIWRRDFETVGGNPIVSGGQLILPTTGTVGNEIIAVDLASAETIWTQPWSGELPRAASIAGDVFFLSGGDNRLYVYNMSNSNVSYIPLDTSSPYAAVVVGERIVVQDENGTLYGFSANADDASPVAVSDAESTPTLVPTLISTATPTPVPMIDPTVVPSADATSTPFPATVVPGSSPTPTPAT